MQLLSLFKDITLHPKNAEELKGLILQFAVLGKLTSNWRDENNKTSSADELLDNIIAHNSEQLALKKRRIKKLSIKPDSVLDLPSNWVQTKNHVLFSLSKGKNPKDLSEAVKKYPYQDIESLARGNVRRYSDDEKAPKCSVNDILVVCDGSRSRLVLDGKDGIVGSTLAIIETPPFIQDYIKILFLQGYQKANSNMKGAAIPHLDTKSLLASDIGLPPLEEQKAIVEVVSELFTEVEQLEELTKKRISLKEDFATSALQRLTQTDNTTVEWNFLQQHFSSFFTEKPNVKKLRETILQLAVQGKLTAKWRSANPSVEEASELLNRIEAEKQQLIAEKKIKKEKQLPPIEDRDKPYELPARWVWCRMGEIAAKLGAGSTPSGGKTAYIDDGIMFFRSQNIHNYYLKLQEVAYIPEDTHKRMKGTKVRPKDLLLNITGGSIGRCALTPDNFDTANVSQHVAIVRMIELETRKYMHQFILSPWFQEKIMDVQVGVSREGLSMTKLKLFPVPLPPLEEQQAIVEKVNAMMSLCDELEEQIGKSEEQIEQLMQSCLREVFEKA